MNYPLALIVYNRPEHLRQVLEALAPQQPKPVYIFCDGPKDAEDLQRVNAARAEARRIDWTGPVTLMRNKHIGLARSIVSAVDKTLAQYESVVVLEDDCVPSPWFMGFMEECLERYANRPEVMAVTGYTPTAAESDVYFSPRMETWGWGTWGRAWTLYERDVADAYRRAVDKGVDLEQGGSDLPGYMRQAIEGKDVWSAGWQLAAYLNGGLCAYPTRSHIRNIGLDGTGAHCGKGVDKAPLAEGPATRFPDGIVMDDRLRGFYG